MTEHLRKLNDAVSLHADKHRTLDEKLFNLGVELGRQLQQDGIADYRLPFFVEQENAENVAKEKGSLIRKAEKMLLDVVIKAYKAEMDASGAITIDASYSADAEKR